MKIHSKACKIIIFSLVFLFFIIPPLFNRVSPAEVFSTWNFPLQQLMLFCLSIILLFINDALCINIKSQKHSISYRLIFPSIFCLCILCSISFLINGLSIIISHNSIQQKLSSPSDFKGYVFCVLTFVFSAFYEETIYRFYLPETLKLFINSENNPRLQKVMIFAAETVTALLFAFAHLYAGPFSVTNALLAHLVLRICIKKTKSIYAGFTAHFLFNIITFILLTFTQP